MILGSLALAVTEPRDFKQTDLHQVVESPRMFSDESKANFRSRSAFDLNYRFGHQKQNT
jgi:hypothetical protein